MTENRTPEPQAAADPNAEIDLEDPVIAWNFGTRELNADEYARFADSNRRDNERVRAGRAADEAYAAWKAANPAEAARQEAEFRAADRAAHPLLYGVVTPELERAIHEAGGWLGYEPEPEAEIG
jgi:hypothetical protein